MALALQPRLAALLRTTTTTTTTTPIRTLTTTARLLAQREPPKPFNLGPSKPRREAGLPNLPPTKGEVDPLRKSLRPQLAPHPYDATKSSMADLIGDARIKSLGSADFGGRDIHVPVRTVPSTGRTVHVSGPVNTARAFQALNVRCTQNRIPAIANRQRFHERGGLKRKRLRRERWRARFKKGFHHTVTRVQELARQGW